MLLFLAAAMLSPCTATDGDTIRCGTERIRLLGIDAPEMPGHCRTARICALGDPWRAKASLVKLLRRQPISVRRFGRDRYGRTLALIAAGGTDLSCWQLRQGHAIYKPKWDNGKALAAICRWSSTRP